MPKSIADETILAAAIATMVEHGYVGATTRQIAAAAGINEVTLFRRFGSKDALLRTAMEAELAAFESAGGARHTGDVQADLERIVSLYLGLVARHGRLIPVLLAELPRRPELWSVVEVPQRVIRKVAEVVTQYQHEGVLRSEPPLQTVASLLAPLLVMGLVRAVGAELQPPAVDPAEHVRRFLQGRGVDEAGRARGRDPAR